VAVLPSAISRGAYPKGNAIVRKRTAFVAVSGSSIMKVVGIDGVCGSLALGYDSVDQSIEGLRSAITSCLLTQV